MDLNVNNKINELLNGLDKSKLNSSKKTIEEFLNTPDGEKLKKQLDGIDKKKLINDFMSMNTEELKEKLNKADLSRLNINEIINKIRK